MHKRLVVVMALAATLVVPAGAMAAGPSKSDKRNASKQCRAERGETTATREAFAAKYGTNESKSNAFGKCVSQKAREEQRERRAAKRSASTDCKAERKEIGQGAFADKYGTNKNKRNAFGKCVSKKAKAAKREMDAEDRADRVARRNAAKACAAERGTTDMSRLAFANKYGSGPNKKNAFGKCVSQKAAA
ncbi:MAG: hypothetical protein M3350_05330 [Actinomycetota bacterium]|nr:hypothetical protein [Actinomycetota bacterium]